MAHHLAELINEAENGATAAKRSGASKKATETILKIWDHRLSLPGAAYPLAPYKDILAVLQRLRPDDNPFRYFSPHTATKRDQLAAGLFDTLTRLILALLLMRLPPDTRSINIDGPAIEALSDEEQYVIKAIKQWADLFASKPRTSARKRKTKKDNDIAKINLSEVAVRLLDSIAATLVDLRNELQITDKSAGKPLSS